MAVSIDHSQVRSVQAGPLYRVLDTVSAATGIDDAVFVYNVETQVFDRVAVTSDLADYPDSRAQAITDGVDYYRQPSVQKDHELLETAIEFGATLRDRMKALCVDYDLVVAGFVGTTTETITS